MDRVSGQTISQFAALVGGFIALLYTFYYVQQLAYSIGVYSGISKTIVSYNITNKTAATVLVGALSQSTTLGLALHFTYTMIPFAVIILAIGVLWLFSKMHSRLTATLIVISAAIYIILAAILEFDFSFQSALSTFPFAYLGGILALAGGAYTLWGMYNRPTLAKRAVQPVSLSSETPYSNMKVLSNRIMKRLSGELKILDMHFDTNSLDNLMQLMSAHMGNYTSISVLTSDRHLGASFGNSYANFKSELANMNIAVELRVLGQDDAGKQHERILMDGSAAYKIPPLNIINKKNEHIVSINHGEAERRFSGLWPKGTKLENLKT